MTTGDTNKARKTRTRILIVDDHPIVRERLSQLINRESDMMACGEAEDGPQALQQLESKHPGLAIVDLSLKDTDGMALIREIRSRYPAVPVLVLSMHDEALYAERVLRAGAMGYIAKQEATQKVLTAIRQVLSGKVYVSEAMSAHLLQQIGKAGPSADPSALKSLSDRELEVFRRIGTGQTTRQIAESFQVSLKTVESYRARIRKKLGINSSTQLLHEAILWVESGAQT